MRRNETSLSIFYGKKLIFTDHGNWIFPLFEMEQFLERSNYEPDKLEVHDRIVGKASACLLVRMGIRTLCAGILSSVGEKVLIDHQIMYTYLTLVPKILCITEDLLKDVDDIEETYLILRTRAGR